jgi:polyhydroxyalkanoate synthesis regulator phasin
VASAQSPSAPQAAGPARSPAAPGAQPAITPRPQPGPITGTNRTVAVAARETPEGLRGWVAQLDRKLGVRTYVGLAVVILALATSVVAIVLAIDARDNSARNQDLNELSDQVAAANTAAQTTEDDLTALEARVQALEDGTAGTTGTGSTSGLAKRLQAVESDIAELQSQIQALQSGKSGSKP